MKVFISVILASYLLAVSAIGAETWFTLGEYRALKSRDANTAELVLKAMHDAVFYGQESVGGSVICASPKPLAGPQLVGLMETELANPTNSRRRPYEDRDHAAFVFLHALKSAQICK